MLFYIRGHFSGCGTASKGTGVAFYNLKKNLGNVDGIGYYKTEDPHHIISWVLLFLVSVFGTIWSGVCGHFKKNLEKLRLFFILEVRTKSTQYGQILLS